MTTNPMHHPDCLPHERWVGNTPALTVDHLPEYLTALTSIRLDGQAYDINGAPLSRDEYRPLIMSDADAAKYRRIMGERHSAICRGLLGR